MKAIQGNQEDEPSSSNNEPVVEDNTFTMCVDVYHKNEVNIRSSRILSQSNTRGIIPNDGDFYSFRNFDYTFESVSSTNSLYYCQQVKKC